MIFALGKDSVGPKRTRRVYRGTPFESKSRRGRGEHLVPNVLPLGCPFAPLPRSPFALPLFGPPLLPFLPHLPRLASPRLGPPGYVHRR